MPRVPSAKSRRPSLMPPEHFDHIVDVLGREADKQKRPITIAITVGPQPDPPTEPANGEASADNQDFKDLKF